MATTNNNTPAMFIWLGGAHLGEAVRVTREAAGTPQATLAKKAGVSRKFLNELEQGKDTLRADKVFRVLRVIGLVPVLLPAAAIGSLGR